MKHVLCFFALCFISLQKDDHLTIKRADLLRGEVINNEQYTVFSGNVEGKYLDYIFKTDSLYYFKIKNNFLWKG